MPPNDEPSDALIKVAKTSLKALDRGEHIVSRMVGEALEIARRTTIQAKPELFQIGRFELREPDYRQIHRWAAELNRLPEDVIEQLSELAHQDSGGQYPLFEQLVEFAHHLSSGGQYNLFGLEIIDGSIRHLVWDGELLPIEAFQWEAGLRITSLQVRNRLPLWTATHPLHSLLSLDLSIPGLTSLDLPKLPQLKHLYCDNHQLTSLDLSPFPELRELWCSGNSLAQLNLSPVPELRRLVCEANELSEINLATVPKLVELWCGGNKLVELNLSPVKNLEILDCSGNNLTTLDLSSQEEIIELGCEYCLLQEIDLSPLPNLIELRCGGNQLTELDLSSVPKLNKLECWCNPLTELDLSMLDDQDIEIECDPDVRIIR